MQCDGHGTSGVMAAAYVKHRRPKASNFVQERKRKSCMRLLILFLWQRKQRSKATATVAPAGADEDDEDDPGLRSHQGTLPRAQAGLLSQGRQGSVTVSSRHGSVTVSSRPGSLPHRLMSMLRPNQVCSAAAGSMSCFAGYNNHVHCALPAVCLC